MSQWDDIEIQSSERPAPRRGLGWPLWVGAGVLAFLLGFLWFFWYKKGEPPAQPAQIAETPPVAATPEPPPLTPEPKEAIELPVLDESDTLVRKLAGTLASHVALAHWLANEDLIRTFVVVVDNIGEGANPAKHLPFLKPAEPFRASYEAGTFYVDPRSYDRYDVMAEVFGSINARRAAEVYRDLRPLIQEAYVEIGYPDRNFDDTLRRAIDHLLSTPVPQGSIALSGETVAYKYVDPRFEHLSAAQKQFLRMGPENVRKVQKKLTELKAVLRLGSQSGSS